jgi:hypothetical protein
VGSNTILLFFLSEEVIRTHEREQGCLRRHGEGHVKTQGERGERPQEKPAFLHIDFVLPASITVKKINSGYLNTIVSVVLFCDFFVCLVSRVFLVFFFFGVLFFCGIFL